MMQVRLAAYFGALAVAGGAFGAHALKANLSAEAMAWWTTGAHYLLAHSIVLLGVSLATPHWKFSKATYPLFTVGALIFTGTLWLMALSGIRVLGAITPVGGACLVAGWLSLLAAKPPHMPTAE